MNKVRVYRDQVISMDGVEKVWAWDCPHVGCSILRTDYGWSTYWDNAIRGAFNHIKWHQKSPVLDWGGHA